MLRDIVERGDLKLSKVTHSWMASFFPEGRAPLWWSATAGDIFHAVEAIKRHDCWAKCFPRPATPGEEQ